MVRVIRAFLIFDLLSIVISHQPNYGGGYHLLSVSYYYYYYFGCGHTATSLGLNVAARTSPNCLVVHPPSPATGRAHDVQSASGTKTGGSIGL